jgi:hypothetical protein
MKALIIMDHPPFIRVHELILQHSFEYIVCE